MPLRDGKTAAARDANRGPVYFVGGAPRSGTTVTHALLCTSALVNRQHPEISYVTPLVRSYTLGLKSWDMHTHAFFASKEVFRQHIGDLLSQTLVQISDALGAPEILCLKDPMLTPHFSSLRALLGERARFVTVVRNPFDVLRSRQEVARKANQDFTPGMAQKICAEYMQMYRHMDHPAFGDSLMHLRYEDLLSDGVLKNLRDFTGCDDISPENIWGDTSQETMQRALKKAEQKAGQAAVDPWFSPKYHGAIDLSRRLPPLGQTYRDVVNGVCAPLMKRFDYPAP